MKNKLRVIRVVVFVLCAAAILVPLLAVQPADAANCVLIQNPYWATYTGGPDGCSGAAYDCQVWVFECE